MEVWAVMMASLFAPSRFQRGTPDFDARPLVLTPCSVGAEGAALNGFHLARRFSARNGTAVALAEPITIASAFG
jgi:hypothetical protein